MQASLTPACMATLMSRGVQLLALFAIRPESVPTLRLSQRQQVKSNQAPLTAIRQCVSSENNRVGYWYNQLFFEA